MPIRQEREPRLPRAPAAEIPNPDPTLRTMELVDRAIETLGNEIRIRLDVANVRFDAMDKAIGIVKDDAVRWPTLIDRSMASLHDLVTQELAVVRAEMTGLVSKLADVSHQQFEGIQTQFGLSAKAADQLDTVNKTAIAAALQAQKESAGETQKTSQAAIAKSEASTSEAIRTLTATFSQQLQAYGVRFDDLKGRLDRGEGGKSVADPAIADTLNRMTLAISALQQATNTSRGVQAGKDYTWAIVGTLAALGIPAIGLLMLVAARLH